jgi:hypothetical protein
MHGVSLLPTRRLIAFADGVVVDVRMLSQLYGYFGLVRLTVRGSSVAWA